VSRAETREPRTDDFVVDRVTVFSLDLHRNGLQQPLPKLVQRGAVRTDPPGDPASNGAQLRCGSRGTRWSVVLATVRQGQTPLRRDRGTVRLHIETLLIDEQLSDVEQASLDQI
jgi:hypothetical protein